MMQILISIWNIFIRLISCIIPMKSVRRRLRNECLFTAVCPSGVEYYIVKNGKPRKQKFIKFGLNIRTFGTGNTVIVDESSDFQKAQIIFRGNNSICKVGKNSTTLNSAYLVYGNDIRLTIGEDCMFSHNVELWCGDAHAIFNIGEKYPYNYGKDITIGNHVWIGAYSKILKGSVIQDNSIVGIQSIVTEKFTESNVIIAGIPAKIVKRNICWDRNEPEKFKYSEEAENETNLVDTVVC